MAKGKARKTGKRRGQEGSSETPTIETTMNGCMGRMRSALRETLTKSQGVVQVEFNFIADRTRVPPIILLNVGSLVGKRTLTDEKIAELTGILGRRLSIDKQHRPNENVRLFLETDDMKISRTDANDEDIRKQYPQHVLEGSTQHRAISDAELSPKPRSQSATTEETAQPPAYMSTIEEEAARFKARSPETGDAAVPRENRDVPAPIPLADAIDAALASDRATDNETRQSLRATNKKSISRIEAAARIRRAREHGIKLGSARVYEELGAAMGKLTRLEEDLKVAIEARDRAESETQGRIDAISAQLQEAISANEFSKERAAKIGQELADERARATQEKRSFDDKIQVLTAEHADALKKMRTELAQLEKRALQLETDLTAAREQGAEGIEARQVLNAELARLNAEAARTSQALAQASADVLKLTALGRGASSELRDLSEAFARLNTEQKSASALEDALGREQSARIDLAEKIGRLEGQIAGHQDEIQKSEAAVDRARAEFEAKLLNETDRIKKRDTEISKWGAVSESLNDMSELLKDPEVIQNTRARTSLLTLVLHYNRKIASLLKDPNSVFTMPDADEILKQVSEIRRDLGAIRSAIDEAADSSDPSHIAVQESLPLDDIGASERVPPRHVEMDGSSEQSLSALPLDTAVNRLAEIAGRWFRRGK